MINRNRWGSWRDEARFMWPEAIAIVNRLRWVYLGFASIACAISFLVGASVFRERPDENGWTRKDLVEWSQKFSGDTEENLTRRFDSCRRERVEEAIPFAFMYARLPSEDEGRTQWHVIAARRFLATFSDDKIQDVLDATKANRPDTAPAIISRTLELIR